MEGKIQLKDLKIRWFLLALVVMIIPFTIITFGMVIYTISTGKSVDSVIAYGNLLLEIIFLVVIARMIIPRKTKILEAIKGLKKEISMKELFGVVLTTAGVGAGSSSIILAIMIFTNINGANEAINEQIMTVTNGADYLIFVILGVLIAPVLEELVFRGILFRRLGKRFGLWVGIIISSIFFGISHITLSVVGATFFGVATCILYMKYKNILVPMAVHFVNNAISFGLDIISGVSIEEMNEVVTVTMNDGIGELTFGVIVLSISMFFFTRFMKNNKQYITRNVEIA